MNQSPNARLSHDPAPTLSNPAILGQEIAVSREMGTFGVCLLDMQIIHEIMTHS